MGWYNGWTEAWPMSWMFFGPVMLLVFVAACIAVVGFMLSSRSAPVRNGDRAIDILREQYARGEINQQEFKERRRLLQT